MDTVFFGHLTLIILAAAICALGARRLQLPTIVAYLLAGLLLGPATGWVQLTTSIKTLSELGIILLLFLVGLELSIEKVKGLGAAVLVAGFLQVGATAVLGFGLALALGFSPREGVFLGVALTFSSTVLAVKLLEEKHQLDALHGRIAVGVLLLQDLVVILLLTLLAAFQPGSEVTARAIGAKVGMAFGGMTLLIAGVLALARWALPRPFNWAARSPSTLLIWSLCWCFFVVAAAHALHLSAESGAFLAGFSLAQSPFSHDLRRRVHPLMNFFIALFFVSLGLQMEFGAAALQWRAAAVFAGFVLLGKLLILVLTLPRLGFGERTSVFAGLTLAQISEFSLILTAAGVAAGWVDAGLLSLVGLVGLATLSISACLIVFQEAIYLRGLKLGIFRWLRPSRPDPQPHPVGSERRGHVIVVGMNTLGRDIARRLHEQGERVLAVDTDPGKLKGLPCETCLGNVEYLSVLEEAGLARARLLVSALRIEPANELLAFRCWEAGVPCAIHVADLLLTEKLLELDVKYLMIPKIDGIKLQNAVLRERGFLPS